MSSVAPVMKKEGITLGDLNPIRKNDDLNIGFLSSFVTPPPQVPVDAALLLYPHDTRELAKAYLNEDTVHASEVRKYHFNKLAHISLKTFSFSSSIVYPFSEGSNQHVKITYLFEVSVRQDKDSIKKILLRNITDISEPILELLNEPGSLRLDRQYSCLETILLESTVFQKINDLVMRIDYLKTIVRQIGSLEHDVVSQKMIKDHEENLRAKAKNEALKEELILKEEEAEIRRREADIARIKAKNEEDLAKIMREHEMAAIDHEIEKKAKEYDSISKQADKREELKAAHNIDTLIALDPRFKTEENLKQERIDRARENDSKNLDLNMKKFDAITKMIDAGALSEEMASTMFETLLMGESSSSRIAIEQKPERGIVINGFIASSKKEDGEDI